MMFLVPPGLRGTEPDNPLYAFSSVKAGWYRELIGLSLIESTDVIDVLVLGFRSNDHHIDLTRAAVGPGCRDTLEKSRWTNAGVLIEPLADDDQRSQGDMVGNTLGIADRAEKNGIKISYNLQVIFWNDDPMVEIVVGPPGKNLQVQIKVPIGLLRRLEDTDRLFGDLDADAISRISGYSKVLHVVSFVIESDKRFFLTFFERHPKTFPSGCFVRRGSRPKNRR